MAIEKPPASSDIQSTEPFVTSTYVESNDETSSLNRAEKTSGAVAVVADPTGETVAVGDVVSMTNGPSQTGSLQFPAPSTVARHNHHEPSDDASKTPLSQSAGWVIVPVGIQAAFCVHATSNPATPESSSAAPWAWIETDASDDGTPGA